MTEIQKRAAPIRLVATDLDGTLFATASELTPRTARAVAAIRARGIYFTICSGRSWYELDDLPRRLGLTEPVICRNGAEIVDPADGRTLFRRLIPPEEGTAFLRYCVEEDIDFCLTTADTACYPPGSVFEQFFGPADVPPAPDRPRVFLAGPDTRFGEMEQYKIILWKKQPRYGLARAFLEKCSGIRTEAASSALEDLVSSQAGKDRGLEWVAGALGLGRENCCAFGDYANDIPMLRYAGLSFAMDNAAPAVKEAADFVAPSNGEDGVAQVLEALFGV